MAAPLHQHQPAAGIAGGQEQLQLFLQRRGHQIQAAAHHQHRHRQGGGGAIGPEQTAEPVEQHQAAQVGRAGQGLWQPCGHQLALQQPGGIADRQPFDRLAAAPGQPRFRLDAGRQQGGQPTERVPHQHHAVAAQGQPAIPAGRQHRGDIAQPGCQGRGPGRGRAAVEGIAQGPPVAAGMLGHRHGPAPLGQGAGKPAELIGIASEPRQHQQPGETSGIRSLARPEVHRQGFAPMRHRQFHPSWIELVFGRQQRSGIAFRQPQGLQGRQGVALLSDLSSPLLRQVEEAVQAQPHLGDRQGAQQGQGGHLAALAQQATQGALQLWSGAPSLGRCQQLADFRQHLTAGPAVQQLASEALLPEQGCPQQARHAVPALRLQQVQPHLQFAPRLRLVWVAALAGPPGIVGDREAACGRALVRCRDATRVGAGDQGIGWARACRGGSQWRFSGSVCAIPWRQRWLAAAPGLQLIEPHRDLEILQLDHQQFGCRCRSGRPQRRQQRGAQQTEPQACPAQQGPGRAMTEAGA